MGDIDDNDEYLVHLRSVLTTDWYPAAGQRSGMTVYARNFKTSETERKIQNATPDADEVNAKLQEYVEQIKVGASVYSIKPLRTLQLDLSTTGSSMMPEANLASYQTMPCWRIS